MLVYVPAASRGKTKNSYKLMTYTSLANESSCRLGGLFFGRDLRSPYSLLKFIAEPSDHRLHGPGSGFTEGTDRIPLDVVRNIHQHVHVLLPPLTPQESVQDFLQPSRPFATRSALTARFMMIELRNSCQYCNKVRLFIHHNQAGRPHRGTCPPHGIRTP